MNEAHAHNKAEKFLFNVNIFDAEAQAEQPEAVEDAPPPPPTYSQDELEAARKAAFEEGKRQGLSEAKASREQQLVQVMSSIAQDVKALFSAEDLREQCFEFETVRLSDQIFRHVFPLAAESFVFEELKATIRQVIDAHERTGPIRVSAHPDHAEGIQVLLEDIRQKTPEAAFSVTGDERLSPAACHITWDHGGAVRDIDAMAQEIAAILKEALAARSAKGHDEHGNFGAPADDAMREQDNEGRTP